MGLENCDNCRARNNRGPYCCHCDPEAVAARADRRAMQALRKHKIRLAFYDDGQAPPWQAEVDRSERCPCCGHVSYKDPEEHADDPREAILAMAKRLEEERSGD